MENFKIANFCQTDSLYCISVIGLADPYISHGSLVSGPTSSSKKILSQIKSSRRANCRVKSNNVFSGHMIIIIITLKGGWTLNYVNVTKKIFLSAVQSILPFYKIAEALSQL